MTNTEDLAQDIVADYFDGKDVENVIRKLEDMGVDIHDEDDVAANFEEACDACKIYLSDNLGERLDNICIYYSDCADIVKEHNYWNGWIELADNAGFANGFDNICQVAYCILEQEFYDDNGMDEAGRYFFDVYLDKSNE